MGRKLWTSPLLPFFRGTDSVPSSRSFQSLTEYLRSHVGYWMHFSGTTDVNGDLLVTHNCGFTPSAVFLTQEGLGGSHDLGAYHINSLTDTTVEIHFLTKAGVDSANLTHAGWLLFMPETESA